ncbi:hypothetical protein G7Z17_g4953 [Cylindrodendrum hubeiense]|uniref:Uncharacterized protein n=1 Tax=Cylindrodendrum hubeiense TaxID=595255 RepID=A0A9P5HF48_9HYPO|nr:hypothetical protein G7Z17_g4953 [Cylindrodendrum hubeiense]
MADNDTNSSVAANASDTSESGDHDVAPTQKTPARDDSEVDKTAILWSYFNHKDLPWSPPQLEPQLPPPPPPLTVPNMTGDDSSATDSTTT